MVMISAHIISTHTQTRGKALPFPSSLHPWGERFVIGSMGQPEALVFWAQPCPRQQHTRPQDLAHSRLPRLPAQFYLSLG